MSSLGGYQVEREVELEHFDTAFAEDTEGATVVVLLHELPQALLRQITRFRDARHLE